MCTTIKDTMAQNCKSILRFTLNALISGLNAQFNQFIGRIKDNIDSGTGANKKLDWNDIIEASRTKCTNMDFTKNWNQVNPCDA